MLIAAVMRPSWSWFGAGLPPSLDCLSRAICRVYMGPLAPLGARVAAVHWDEPRGGDGGSPPWFPAGGSGGLDPPFPVGDEGTLPTPSTEQLRGGILMY